MPLRLRPLREDELPACMKHGRAAYARDLVTRAGLSPEQAATKTTTDWARLFRRTGSLGYIERAVFMSKNVEARPAS